MRPLTDYLLYRILLVCAIIIGTIVLMDNGPSQQEEADDTAAELERVTQLAKEECLARGKCKPEK